MMCRSSHSSCIFTPSHFISEGGVGPLFERGPEVGPFLSWELTQTPVHVYSRDITEIPSWSGTVLSATRALKKGPTLIPAHMGQTTEQYYPHILFSLNGRYCCEKDHFPCVNPRTYTESHTSTVVKGGGELMVPPWLFYMLQYFETVLPWVESLWSSLQDEVYFMVGGAAGGLWRHQTWSPSWPPPFNTNNYFASSHPQVLLLLLKKVEKTCIFT